MADATQTTRTEMELQGREDEVTSKTIIALYEDILEAYCIGARSAGDRHELADLMRVHLEGRGCVVEKRGTRGKNAFRGVRHSYLLVTDAPNGMPRLTPVIIDTAFRDLFDIARHSPRYAEVFDAIPEVLVRTPPALRAYVIRLCDEMGRSFLETGLSVPPARQARNMLWRWDEGLRSRTG